MFEKKLTEEFPLIAGKLATVFRYDRWYRLLILKIMEAPDLEEKYLVFHNCEYIQFGRGVDLDEVRIIHQSEKLHMYDKTDGFMLKCASVDLWDENKYDSYNDELDDSVGTERYNITRREVSLETLE